MNSGYLMPPDYVPVFYPQTVYYPAYATPTYYPPAFFGGRRFGAGYYNMGPSAAYLSRVTGRNRADINQTITRNSTNITRIHSVVPPRGVIDRHAYIRQIIPPALAQGHRLPPPQLASNVNMARVNLNRPNFVPPPKNVPKITATIPRVQPAARQPGRGLPGTALPTKATMPLTPQMTQQIQQLPAKQRFEPAKAQPFKPAAAHPGPGQVQPGQFKPVVPAQRDSPGPGDAGTGHRPRPAGPGPAGHPRPGAVQPGAPPAGQAKPGEFHPVVRPGTANHPGCSRGHEAQRRPRPAPRATQGTASGKTPGAPATPGAAETRTAGPTTA